MGKKCSLGPTYSGDVNEAIRVTYFVASDVDGVGHHYPANIQCTLSESKKMSNKGNAPELIKRLSTKSMTFDRCS